MGTASHTPMSPKTVGRSNSIPVSITSVRRKEITAEILPLQRAVKKEEPKMFMPQKRKERAYNRKPEVVIASSSLFPSQKISVTGPAVSCAVTTIRMETVPITFRQRWKRFCSSSWFSAP